NGAVGDLLAQQLRQQLELRLQGEHARLPVGDEKDDVEHQRVGAEPLGELAHRHEQHSQQQDTALPGQLGILEADALDQVREEGEHEGAAAAQKLVFVTTVVEQLIAQVLDVEQVGAIVVLDV